MYEAVGEEALGILANNTLHGNIPRILLAMVCNRKIYTGIKLARDIPLIKN